MQSSYADGINQTAPHSLFFVFLESWPCHEWCLLMPQSYPIMITAYGAFYWCCFLWSCSFSLIFGAGYFLLMSSLLRPSSLLLVIECYGDVAVFRARWRQIGLRAWSLAPFPMSTGRLGAESLSIPTVRLLSWDLKSDGESSPTKTLAGILTPASLASTDWKIILLKNSRYRWIPISLDCKPKTYYMVK